MALRKPSVIKFRKSGSVDPISCRVLVILKLPNVVVTKQDVQREIADAGAAQAIIYILASMGTATLPDHPPNHCLNAIHVECLRGSILQVCSAPNCFASLFDVVAAKEQCSGRSACGPTMRNAQVISDVGCFGLIL